MEAETRSSADEDFSLRELTQAESSLRESTQRESTFRACTFDEEFTLRETTYGDDLEAEIASGVREEISDLQQFEHDMGLSPPMEPPGSRESTADTAVRPALRPGVVFSLGAPRLKDMREDREDREIRPVISLGSVVSLGPAEPWARQMREVPQPPKTDKDAVPELAAGDIADLLEDDSAAVLPEESLLGDVPIVLAKIVEGRTEKEEPSPEEGRRRTCFARFRKRLQGLVRCLPPSCVRRRKRHAEDDKDVEAGARDADQKRIEAFDGKPPSMPLESGTECFWDMGRSPSEGSVKSGESGTEQDSDDDIPHLEIAKMLRANVNANREQMLAFANGFQVHRNPKQPLDDFQVNMLLRSCLTPGASALADCVSSVKPDRLPADIKAFQQPVFSNRTVSVKPDRLPADVKAFKQPMFDDPVKHSKSCVSQAPPALRGSGDLPQLASFDIDRQFELFGDGDCNPVPDWKPEPLADQACLSFFHSGEEAMRRQRPQLASCAEKRSQSCPASSSGKVLAPPESLVVKPWPGRVCL